MCLIIILGGKQMLHQYTNQYGRVLLKPLEHKDLEELRLLRNKERKWFVYSKELSANDQEEWFEKYKKASNDYMFSVFHISNPEIFIGAAALYNVNADTNTAEFGRIIIDGSKVGGQGLGYDTTICICQIGFEQLKLNRIILYVFPDNVKAIKTYEKSGFVCIPSENSQLLLMELTKEKYLCSY